jgi:transcriptional regulator with XRE-family HTH domain
MSLSFKLVSFREYKRWQTEEVAKKLGVSTESYLEIEKGRVKINDILADKLSSLYQVPKDFFLAEDTPHYLQAEVIYSNCTFVNGAGSSSGYINHQYNDRGIDEIVLFKKEELKKLQAQINQLEQQNKRLMELLSDKLIEETK